MKIGIGGNLIIMEDHPYIVNPFADIICTVCKYAVKVNTGTTLFIALYDQERRNKNHPFPHDEDCLSFRRWDIKLFPK